MNRGERREISKRKWISRARKVYYSFNNWLVPKEGIKVDISRVNSKSYFKRCESFTEFLDKHKYAKILKNCTSLHKNIFRFDNKFQNRKERHSSKKKINEDLYESGMDLDCSMCICNETCKEYLEENSKVYDKYWD